MYMYNLIKITAVTISINFGIVLSKATFMHSIIIRQLKSLKLVKKYPGVNANIKIVKQNTDKKTTNSVTTCTCTTTCITTCLAT